MRVCVGGGVAKCIDLNARSSLEKQGLDWGWSKGFVCFAAAKPSALSHQACYPAVTDGFHTWNNCPGFEPDVSTACSTDVS